MEIVDFDTQLWALGTNGLNRAELAACNICFLKTINYIKVQKYLFGINGFTKQCGNIKYYLLAYKFQDHYYIYYSII